MNAQAKAQTERLAAKMKQGTHLIAKQAFTMKNPGSRGRAVSVKIGDNFIVTSPLHMNEEFCIIDRASKAKINSGYKLKISDINNLFEVV